VAAGVAVRSAQDSAAQLRRPNVGTAVGGRSARSPLPKVLRAEGIEVQRTPANGIRSVGRGNPLPEQGWGRPPRRGVGRSTDPKRTRTAGRIPIARDSRGAPRPSSGGGRGRRRTLTGPSPPVVFPALFCSVLLCSALFCSAPPLPAGARFGRRRAVVVSFPPFFG
jgi:hypothetical protein